MKNKKDFSYKRKNTRQIGTRYECLAETYLREKGYCILERNFRCRLGEIDIIAVHENTLVFVEVKYRAQSDKGYPSDAVNRKKQMRISDVASYYVYTHQQFSGYYCRFDVVSIVGEQIFLYKNAFFYCGRFIR